MTKATLTKANFHLVEKADGDICTEDKNACINCMFEYHGKCTIHNVKVPENGKCDNYD